MRIAVTGAAGHLGSHLCPMLAERGYELIRTDIAEAPDGPGEFRQADLADPRPVIERHWPGAWDFFAAHGITPAPRPTVFNLSRAEHLLGWQPTHNFDWWWRQHQT